MAESTNTAFRRGGALQKLQDLLIIVFSGMSKDYKEQISKCYKVHVEAEQQSPKKMAGTSKDGWIQPKATLKKTTAKIVSYWCFSPGFGYVTCYCLFLIETFSRNNSIFEYIEQQTLIFKWIFT